MGYLFSETSQHELLSPRATMRPTGGTALKRLRSAGSNEDEHALGYR